MLRAGMLDELIVYMAPCLLGSEARPLLHLPLNTMLLRYQFCWRHQGNLITGFYCGQRCQRCNQRFP